MRSGWTSFRRSGSPDPGMTPSFFRQFPQLRVNRAGMAAMGSHDPSPMRGSPVYQRDSRQRAHWGSVAAARGTTGTRRDVWYAAAVACTAPLPIDRHTYLPRGATTSYTGTKTCWEEQW
jgi:hypothetical protein